MNPTGSDQPSSWVHEPWRHGYTVVRFLRDYIGTLRPFTLNQLHLLLPERLFPEEMETLRHTLLAWWKHITPSSPYPKPMPARPSNIWPAVSSTMNVAVGKLDAGCSDG